MINPMTLLKLGRMKNEFTARHPRVAAFIRNELLTGVPEDTVFEISMTKPGHDTVTCNMLVTREDLELLQERTSKAAGALRGVFIRVQNGLRLGAVPSSRRKRSERTAFLFPARGFLYNIYEENRQKVSRQSRRTECGPMGVSARSGTTY